MVAAVSHACTVMCNLLRRTVFAAKMCSIVATIVIDLCHHFVLQTIRPDEVH